MRKELSLDESANTLIIFSGTRFETAWSLSFTGDIFHVTSSPASSWLCFINYITIIQELKSNLHSLRTLSIFT